MGKECVQKLRRWFDAADTIKQTSADVMQQTPRSRRHAADTTQQTSRGRRHVADIIRQTLLTRSMRFVTLRRNCLISSLLWENWLDYNEIIRGYSPVENSNNRKHGAPPTRALSTTRASSINLASRFRLTWNINHIVIAQFSQKNFNCDNTLLHRGFGCSGSMLLEVDLWTP